MRAAKSRSNCCSASLKPASEIFITIGGLSCARAAPGSSAIAKASAPAIESPRAKPARPATFLGDDLLQIGRQCVVPLLIDLSDDENRRLVGQGDEFRRVNEVKIDDRSNA